jgi:hypothetical protein
LRSLALTAVTGVAMTIPLSGAAALAAVPAGATHAGVTQAGSAPAAKPGPVGKPITLANNVSLSGYDAATSTSGTTYLGWIASTSKTGRTVFLCVLPLGKSSCSGGVQSTASLGASSAASLQVVIAGGVPTLVWFHDTTASESNPEGSEIATATVRNGKLSAAKDSAKAPSFGSLLDAVPGSGGIWAVTAPSSGNGIQVVPGLGSKPVKVNTPYEPGHAQLAFSGSTAILAIQKAGAITEPVSFADKRGGGWSSFHTVAHTWTSDANLGLVHTGSGVRLLASVDNADFFPVVSRWTGSSFSAPKPTGDKNNCTPNSHDPVADSSGRMADVTVECEVVTVTNMPDTLHAFVVRFASGGTTGDGSPQITTTPRGKAWVMWSIESSAITGFRLLAVPVLLPGGTRTVTKTSKGNTVKLTGPASCLPPVSLTIKVKGSPARHWRASKGVLQLNGKTVHSPLNGASLAAGKTYTLTGKVTFTHSGTKRVVTAQLTFRSCPSP